jgi:hypothetical protein
MRLVLAVAVFAAALCFDIPAGRATGIGPWCAVVSVGTGNVIWDCQYRTFEECRPNVLAGNRGFCNLNPWYAHNASEPKTHQKRHIQR